jgi:hypothetical protein
MKQINFYFCVLAVTGLFLLTSCGEKLGLAEQLWAELDLTAAPNTLVESERNAGWQLLFDGRTTNGWRGYNMQGVPGDWEVENGTLTVNGTGGGEEQDVITNGIYRNFAFTVEYKLTEGANSGIIFQIKEDPKYKFPYETGPEFQLVDTDGFPGRLEDWQSNGANYAMYPPRAIVHNPVGEWNRLMIVVKDHHVTQILNGVVIVEYEKYSDEWNALRNSGKWMDFPDYGKYDEGHISLQNHGHKLWFRNIKLKQL